MSLLVACGDAGGAAALSPVIHELMRRGEPLEIFAENVAAGVFEAEGFSVQRVRFEGDVFPQTSSRILVTGSSQGARAELTWIVQARERAIPSLAVLDHWCNYRERFLSREGRLTFPDQVAVMDAQAAEEMKSAGLPADRVFVSGSPALEAASKLDVCESLKKRKVLRESIGILSDEKVLLFVSQPFGRFPETSRGMDERKVLGELQRISRKLGTRILVKTHPLEELESFEGEVKICPRSWEKKDAVFASDLVVGVSSQMLLEAASWGAPVVTYQPGWGEYDPFPANRWGWTKRVQNFDDLEKEIQMDLKVQATEWRPRYRSEDQGAAHRLADQILLKRVCPKKGN